MSQLAESISQNKTLMFQLVKQAINSGFKGSSDNQLPKFMGDKPFNEKLATFVTLHLNGELRGCIGSLEAYQSLAEDLYKNAYSAAFRDPRFNPLTEEELANIDVEISVLTTPQPIEDCYTKQRLLEQLQPFKDGLIISDGAYKATFLPSVWKQLPEKEMFVDYLMRKAGIREWSESIRCQRYAVASYQSEWNKISE